MSDKEYDAFGPWIIEIKEDDDIPPIFRLYIDKNKEKTYAIKIPRQIDRRNAQPGMDLYDCVIIMYDATMLILNRKEKSVISKEVEYKMVYAIKNKKDLLNNLLTIHLPNEVVSIKYTVSGAIISKTVDLIRSKYLDSNEITVKNTMSKREINITSFYYNNMLQLLKKNDDQIEVLAFQPSMKVKRFFKLLYGKIKIPYKSVLQSSLFVTNHKEIIILSSANLVKGAKDVDYTGVHTFIPVNRIKGISLLNDEEINQLNNIIINLGSFSFDFPIDMNQTTLDVYKWAKR